MNAPATIIPPPVLTRGQRQVLDLLVLGQSAREIAVALGIGEKGAESAIINVRMRLGARNAAHAAALALVYGLTDPARIRADNETAVQLGLIVRRAGRHCPRRLDP